MALFLARRFGGLASTAGALAGGVGVFVGVFAGGAADATGFVDFFRKFVNEIGAVEVFWFSEVNEGEMGGFEEFFEILRGGFEGVTGSFGGFVAGFGELDGADGAQGMLIAEDKIDGLVLDEVLGGLAILGTDLVIEKGRDFDLRDDIEFFTKKLNQELETELFGAFHEAFAGAVAGAGLETLAALTDADAGENGHEK